MRGSSRLKAREEAPTIRSVGIDRQEHAAGRALKFESVAAHGGDRGPPRRQLLTFLNRNALEEIDELWASGDAEEMRRPGRTARVHRSSIRRAQRWTSIPRQRSTCAMKL